MPTESWTWRAASRPGIAALKANWLPFLIIQVFAAVLVVLYYQNEGMRQGAKALENVKVAGGLPFAFLSGAVAGGLIPELAKLITGRLKKLDTGWLRDTAFNALVYGLIGMLVDVFYKQQAIWFGNGNDATTLFLKTIVDMIPFTMFLSIPFAISLFEWRKLGFQGLVGGYRHGFYRHKVIPALIPCWAFWVPILICCYALPLNLQFPFAMLAEAAWSIMFVFIATGRGADGATL
jgi:hypothetical protein